MNVYETLTQGKLEEIVKMLTTIAEEIGEGNIPKEYIKAADRFYRECTEKSYTREELLDGLPMIVGPKHGLSFITANQIAAISRQKEGYKQHIKDLLETVILPFSPENRKGLSRTKIVELLGVVQDLNYLPVVNSYQNRLKILCIPHIHRDFNSSYFGGINCMLSSVRHKDNNTGSSEYIFLYEIGCAFLDHLNEGKLGIPKEFGPILKEGFSKPLIEKAPLEDIEHIYCDCFTLAVCEQYDYLQELNPFCRLFSSTLKHMIIEYFQEAASEYCLNHPNRHPMDDFLEKAIKGKTLG